MSLTATSPAEIAAAVAQRPFTVGVEEEFLLLDPDSWVNMAVADEAREALASSARERSRVEFRRSMLEMVTPVCTDLPQVRRHLLENRVAAAESAAAVGAQLVAVAATPIAEPDRTVVDTPRFHAIARHYGPIAYDPALCGCHIHVSVPDRALAIQVCNAIRPWLPVLQAITANSPFHAGEDTGHASWRSIALERWPSLGPSPYLESIEDYERTVNELVATGVMLDSSMVLWWARPSSRYPTVEVRVGDVCPTAEDTVLVAGLVRALVANAVADVAAGRPSPRLPDHLLRAAHWNAAHSGLEGTLTDLHRRAARPAWQLVDELVATIGPALDHHDDREAVRVGLARLREQGNGATRQRRVHAHGGGLLAVLRDLAAATTNG
ncbi:glutamate--cysteine ligase [Dactylosporangium darangshiense]|uniref:Putative glutamate--cysteine ligase 2 n=1 Tax=Dactylosporangium darangshiense TaxID=579108 RepID=A0ABP8DUX2_9ACTN